MLCSRLPLAIACFWAVLRMVFTSLLKQRNSTSPSVKFQITVCFSGILVRFLCINWGNKLERRVIEAVEIVITLPSLAAKVALFHTQGSFCF